MKRSGSKRKAHRPRFRVAIGDGAPMYLSGLRSLLESVPAVTVVSQSQTTSALAAAIRRCKPDFVISSLLSSGGRRGGPVPPMVRTIAGLSVPFSFILICPNRGICHSRLFPKGRVSACVSRSAAAATMSARLLRAMKGGSPAVRCREYSKFPAKWPTPRELEVLSLVASGATNRQAAQALGISVRTVEAHRANLKRKSGAGPVANLVRLAVRLGLNSG